MADNIIYLNEDFVPTTKEKAKIVKVIKPDGTIVFGVPATKRTKRNRLENIGAIMDELFNNSFPGHRGRPGKVGGSLPRSASSAVHVKAEERHKKFAKAEPAITKEMEDLAKKTGGRLYGMKYRLKTLQSTKRKVSADAEEFGISHEEAVDGITDIVRYTMAFDDPEEFADAVSITEKEMKEDGYKRYDNKRKNYFKPNSVYEGYNTVWMNRDGLPFELQFHTEKSLVVKEVNHKIYQKLRLSSNEAERAGFIKQMIENWSSPDYGYVRPKNFEKLSSGD